MTVKNLKNIAIIGGGPGGLMLGLLIQRLGYNYTIFEKGNPHDNHQRGGSLDIHSDTGQLPIKKAGIYNEFMSCARFEGEDTRVIGADGTIYYEEDAEGDGERPEIDRGELCDIIMKQIDSHHLKYGYEFESLVQHSTQDIEIIFTNGESEHFDLVVGADGSFSKLRTHLSDVKIEYSGISMIEINIDDVKNQHPALYKYNKNGKMMALGGDQALLAQLNGDGRIKAYVSYRMDMDKLDTYKFMTLSELKEQLLLDFSGWDIQLQKYIMNMSDDVLFRRIYKLPIGFKWQHKQAITLIGDAAHLMSPFAGEGVNMALYDAFILARALEDYEKIDVALNAYEQEMYQISSTSAQASQDNLELMFSEDAAKKLGEFFKN